MRFLLILFVFVFATLSPAAASDDIDITAFETLPVLEGGRVKPLGAYARIQMKYLSGDESDAAAKLTRILFAPNHAYEDAVIQIKDDALKHRLKLPLQKEIFTLAELQNGITETQQDVVTLLQNPDEELTQQQRALLEVHDKVLLYQELLRSFSFLLPLNIDVPDQYIKDATAPPQSFLDLLPIKRKIVSDLKRIITRKGKDPTRYNDNENAIAVLAFQIETIRAGGQDNDHFRVIKSEEEYFAPWRFATTKDYKNIPAYWFDMAKSYRMGDAQAWLKATQIAQKDLVKDISILRLKTELFYYKIKPYHYALALYAIGCLFLCCAALWGRRIFYIFGMASSAAALLFHVGGIAARVYILQRPPVGTLYESVLFVAAICAAMALLIGVKTRDIVTPLVGGGVAFGLLILAPVMLQSQDSLELLVAVLNTNFWLTTHVIVITAGYGVCLITACLAYVYLAMCIKTQIPHKTKKEANATLLLLIHKSSLTALLLTAVGTVLGGIWADQSWGRFWGWDPKENGALFNVLWLIWLQHGRISGHLNALNYCAGTALTAIVVALSWFGVNLLGVGLHSYGFTSGIAQGLFVFCALAFLSVAGLWGFARRGIEGSRV